MPTTEIILPALKQDLDSVAYFHNTIKVNFVSVIKAAAGVKHFFLGEIVTEDNISSSDYKPVVAGIEWEQPQNFHDFLSSEPFGAFQAAMKPIAAGPPLIQLCDTDFSPLAAFSAPITEVFSVELGEVGMFEKAKEAWEKYVNAVEQALRSDAQKLGGKSLNLTPEKFVGVVGWDSFEARGTVLKVSTVANSKASLQSLEGFDSFVAQLTRQ